VSDEKVIKLLRAHIRFHFFASSSPRSFLQEHHAGKRAKKGAEEKKTAETETA
jgi:hypothetical protein